MFENNVGKRLLASFFSVLLHTWF